MVMVDEKEKIAIKPAAMGKKQVEYKKSLKIIWNID